MRLGDIRGRRSFRDRVDTRRHRDPCRFLATAWRADGASGRATLDSAPAQVLGFDIAKDTVTFFDSQTQTTHTIANQHRAIARVLDARGRGCLVVCEPTGGHERPLLEECLKAGLPVHRADTTRLKAFIRSLGKLASE